MHTDNNLKYHLQGLVLYRKLLYLPNGKFNN